MMRQKSKINSQKPKDNSPKLEKFLSLLLYTLPVAFFVLCYFAIITSGEDIFQGAGTPPNILSDALAAFNHSARLADMFAWAVINFFDYSFSFGPDLFFRLLDVATAFAIFYLATYFSLQRRPRLKLSDALTFNFLFLLVMLTSNGPTIYSGFSKIHNYLFISLFTLLFLIPFSRDLLKKSPLPERLWKKPWVKKSFPVLSLILGFLFGLASNISAVVFLLTLPVFAIYKKLKKSPLKIREFLLSWRGLAVLGNLFALFIIYVLGPGLADYETSEAYLIVCDYLPLSGIFTNLGPSILRIIKHNLYNFGKFLLPFLVVSVPAGLKILSEKLSKKSLKFGTFSRNEKNFLAFSLIFLTLHILCLSQIFYPTRLLFPEYLFAGSIFIFAFKRILSPFKPRNEKTLVRVISAVFVALTCLIFALRAYFAYGYLKKVLPVLEEIKISEEDSLCVPEEVSKAPFIPYLHLNQEDFLVDWAMPQIIYNKKVFFCSD